MRPIRGWIATLAVGLAMGCAPKACEAPPPPSSEAATPHVVGWSEEVDREAFGRSVRAMLKDERYDELQAKAESLLASGDCWPSGVPRFATFLSRGLGKVGNPKQAELWEHFERLEDWARARPNSWLQPLAKGVALSTRAGQARGDDWASNVSADQWKRMNSDAAEAERVLIACPRVARETAAWYDEMLSVLHMLGRERDAEYRVVLKEALARWPLHYSFYIGGAIHLMPRWYGEAGEWQRFADVTTRALPDSVADEFYARIVQDQSHYHRNVFRENPGLSWERVRNGLDAWHRHCPASTQPMSAKANLAWMAGNRPACRHAFEALGDTLDVDVWMGWPRYRIAKRFALGS